MEAARPWFDRKSQTLSADMPDALMAYADPTRVAQVVTNLLHNAAKFTPENGTVRIELSTANGNALLRVIDSGAGILPDQLERVFDMFARIPRPGITTEPGLGIGLSLARRLAEMHGGSLNASSDGEGKGTTFTLRIPLLLWAETAASAPASAESRESGSPLDIVVVEDNDDIADGLKDWLEVLGHRVAVARDGKSGFERISQSRPQLVLCDLGLPGLDGLEVCRLVRALPADAQPIMVALTGWGREDDLRRTKEAGFDHHLVKPVSPEKLQAVLRGAHRASP
jgi:CheY-like chemotaxis protein